MGIGEQFEFEKTDRIEPESNIINIEIDNQKYFFDDFLDKWIYHYKQGNILKIGVCDQCEKEHEVLFKKEVGKINYISIQCSCGNIIRIYNGD